MDGNMKSKTGPGVGNEGFEMDEKGKGDRLIENVTSSNPTISSRLSNNFVDDKNSSQRNRKKVSVNIPENDRLGIDNPEKIEFKDLDFDPNDTNIAARIIDGVRLSIYHLVVKNKTFVKYLALVLIFVLYNAYFITAILYNRRHKIDWQWCDGHGLLIILTGLTYWGLFYYHVIKKYFGKAIYGLAIKPVLDLKNRLFSIWYIKVVIFLAVLGGIAAFIIIDAMDNKKRMISALGVIVILLIGLLFSRHPGRIKWDQVMGGILIQFIFGLLILRWQGGRDFLTCVSEKVARFLRFADDGSSFIYGYLSSGNLTVDNSTLPALEKQSLLFGTLFAFQALSVIYFFSFCVGLLYHLGVMTWVVMKVGWVLQVLLGTTAAESMNASANIFLGQTEAPILIKPFLNEMTKSEIHAVMTGGFATIAGSVMAAYISFGVNASSLLTASVMAAPAALSMSKLLYPETQVTKTSAKDIKAMNLKSEGNALDAAAQGAAQGFILIGNIIANLIAVISFVAFLNAIVAWIGHLVGQEDLSFEWILSKIFVPIAICLGVDSKDTDDIALLLGLKTVVNEFVAYQTLKDMKNLTERSRTIAEFALCSFANFSSVGIQLGGLSTLAPARRLDFSAVVWYALIAGTLASLLNACVAGALME